MSNYMLEKLKMTLFVKICVLVDGKLKLKLMQQLEKVFRMNILGVRNKLKSNRIGCGRQDKNILSRRNRGLGKIYEIMQILKLLFFGKYYFELALILRSSLLLSYLLFNSEAWVNLTEKNIRGLEQTDDILLAKILESDSNTSNVLKYI